MSAEQTLPLGEIDFGERDALHEYLKQDRKNSDVLDNSFVVPPRIKMADFETGAKFFVVGPKGSGKTTVLLNLYRKSTRRKSKLILFKSEIRKEDRDRLDKMVDLIVVQDQNKYRLEADYKTVWEWYIIKNVIALISEDDVIDGANVLNDLKIILGVEERRYSTFYDNFHIEKIKGKVKLALGVKSLKSELSAEIEARKKGNEIEFLDLVRLIQQAFSKITLRHDTKVRIYFDELEFFMSDDAEGERDRRLVRDLIFSVNATNILFAKEKLNIIILASIRSEIINSIETTGQEVTKIIDAFGSEINWYHEDSDTHSIIEIVQNKIIYSEIEVAGQHSSDVWASYFPAYVDGEPIKSYLLNQGLHRPRGVVLCLNAAARQMPDKKRFESSTFANSEAEFGRLMLQEFVEEMSAAYDENSRESILSLFRGYPFAFFSSDIDTRLGQKKIKGKTARSYLKGHDGESLIRYLFKIGMIGNQYFLKTESGVDLSRNHWFFRGDFDPIIDQRFVLHRSVRKALLTL